MPSNSKEYQRQYYLNNKEYYFKKAIAWNSQQREYLKRFLNRYKLWKGCVECGYRKHPEALHFDHVKDRKTDNLSTMMRHGYSLKRVKKEVRKCEVRCANCHAIVTAERRNGDPGEI